MQKYKFSPCLKGSACTQRVLDLSIGIRLDLDLVSDNYIASQHLTRSRLAMAGRSYRAQLNVSEYSYSIDIISLQNRQILANIPSSC
jgi:hypothetical protein